MNLTVFYTGTSLLAPLRQAEHEINQQYGIDLRVAPYNFGSPFSEEEWRAVEKDLREAEIVFVIHVMDGENAARLIPLLDKHRTQHRAVVVINCMPELMRRTRMGRLDFAQVSGNTSRKGAKAQREERQGSREGAKAQRGERQEAKPASAINLLSSIGSWIGRQARGNGAQNGHGRAQYLKLADRLPLLLRFIPNAGKLRDVKNYLYLFCYFLQPTPANIRSMILYALKHYVRDARLKRIRIVAPEKMPSAAIYHPDAPGLFESFEAYKKWYSKRSPIHRLRRLHRLELEGKTRAHNPQANAVLDPKSTVGLLLLRPQVISRTTKHYDGLIRAVEAEGLSVIPALSTLMDNREACERFFVGNQFQVSSFKFQVSKHKAKDQSPKSKRTKVEAQTTDHGQLTTYKSRVSQIVSLTGFSFVGGPAMSDSEAASKFLRELDVPLRSCVSLDTQSIESWRESLSGLNPVQTGMQVAIPEIDGATEPSVFGGITKGGVEPAALEDRCQRIARRLKRWQRLQTAPHSNIRLAFIVYCFPPNKGNIGTAADLDVFPSLWDILRRLQEDGYATKPPSSADALREMLLGQNSPNPGATAHIAYSMNVEEYLRLCPYVAEIESEWGRAPGRINSFAGELLIQGVTLGKVFVGVQPTFGYEDDPMRLLMARGGAPHHGFMAFYTYLAKVFGADAVVHVGTHGAMEFMPGKQVGLSSECWPDRLIGELPNIYIYSVNNPSEGTIAKRRSYAELISYLTPPIENAGLYKELAALKDLVMTYRQTAEERERERLFGSIEECSRRLNFQ